MENLTRQIAYKGLQFLKGKELEAELAKMPFVECDLVHEQVGSSRGNALKRDQYSAVLVFHYLLKRQLRLTLDEYQLIALGLDKMFVDNLVKKSVKVRLVRTDWPAKDGKEAFVTWKIEAPLDPDLIRVETFRDDDLFIVTYKRFLAANAEFAKKYSYWVHIPGENESPEFPKADPVE
jgi:hypothetical protein